MEKLEVDISLVEKEKARIAKFRMGRPSLSFESAWGQKKEINPFGPNWFGMILIWRRMGSRA